MRFQVRATSVLGFGFIPLVIPLILVIQGCSHGRPSLDADPRAMFSQACSPGLQVGSVKGSVWLKAKSKEASGQFPALVNAPSPERLKMEITNLVGGTEAVISVEGRQYSIEVPHHKDRSEKGESSWGGIPLQWANALFLGRIPCPNAELAKDASLSRGEPGSESESGKDELVVETKASLDHLPEKFVYRLKQVEGSLWPDGLHWERQGVAGSAPVSVDFKFEDPEPKTRSPRKWEAKGAQGEVKVRWRDRQIEMTR